MVVEDLLSILKNEVANKKNKNVDILSLSSQICLKLNGKCLLYSNTQRKYKLSVVLIFLYIFYTIQRMYIFYVCKCHKNTLYFLKNI